LSPDEKDTLLKNEVEKRLDDLFGEDEGSEYLEKPEVTSDDEGLGEYQDTLEYSEVEAYEDTQEIDPNAVAEDEDASPTKLEEEAYSPTKLEDEDYTPDEIEEEDVESFMPDEIEEETFMHKTPRFEELEAIILSIDWEINDETMSSLKDQVELLKEDYKDDKVVVMFLRLLGSVGKYIKNNKANAHPGSIKLLNSVYQNLEKVVLDENLAENMRERLLLGEVETFKKLKDEIAIRKAEIRKKQAAEIKKKEKLEKPEAVIRAQDEDVYTDESQIKEADVATSRLTPHEAFYFAMEEIKGIIQAEFKALRAELKLWRES